MKWVKQTFEPIRSTEPTVSDKHFLIKNECTLLPKVALQSVSDGAGNIGKIPPIGQCLRCYGKNKNSLSITSACFHFQQYLYKQYKQIDAKLNQKPG